MSQSTLERLAEQAATEAHACDPRDEALADFLAKEKAVPEPIERGAAQLLDIVPLDFVDLAGKRPPPRSWVVQDWIPRRAVTLMVGRGGVGKSLLAQQIGTSIAGAKDWLGPVPRAGQVVGLFCEDDHDELWRRQVDICRAMNLPMEGVGPVIAQREA